MTTNFPSDTPLNDQAWRPQTQQADQALDAMLRADARVLRADYVDNDGFSDAVMRRVGQLPPPASAQTFGKFATPRFVIVSAAAAIASSIAIVGSGGGNLLIDAVMDLATFTITPSVVALAGLLLVACAAAIVTATT